ncbi:MAG: NAD-dependent epimerase/dehydratase family protein [Gammaproteobacteria bacterium]|nr:NAD-dependent epimerase/dehydratase family protein [Gammaproteobacteria bacterium]MBU1506664.1 NAD-dependent epimerase/dehydratase family protein [Gammaproteobacteria bacterium]MBU2121630.1 NAD-dependent epimerase/dehydratase family protein [Gammaproteobacteria bacterium]MBU2173262.1 NAD-dependent epimerase/dehydratase family protein [Gammaproteobacteria bacterium]MBU2201010.1 NAD-dependent epimerase/dehydratase family protein [Gammaproteobacteria bacterium]
MARVVVTGAAGYLASWVVKLLLEQGHTVHGTVRSLKDSRKLAHLQRLSEVHPGQLALFEADLLSAQGFEAAMQDCSVVLHTASPYKLGPSADPERELIAPAMNGTRHVLEAVNHTASVQRVVITSSIVAMYGDSDELQSRPRQVLNETDVNTTSTVQSNPYALSKTRAEALAWDMQAQQKRWSLVSVHPGAIFGPSLSQRDDATSVQLLRQFLDGSFSQGVPRLWLGTVDVRDVAQAHVRAALQPTASGRYIVVGETLRLLEIAQRLRQSHPALGAKLPTKEVPKWLMWLIAPMAGMTRSYVQHNVGRPLQFNTARSQAELAVTYRPAAVTLSEHVLQLVADGLAPA